VFRASGTKWRMMAVNEDMVVISSLADADDPKVLYQEGSMFARPVACNYCGKNLDRPALALLLLPFDTPPIQPPFPCLVPVLY
jgi:hypothetical protein